MRDTNPPITFVIAGREDTPSTARGLAMGAAASELPVGRLKHSVRIGAERAGAPAVRVSAVPGEDVVMLQVNGGPALVLHPENARDLLLAQTELSRSARVRSTDASAEIAVPARLRWRGLEDMTPARRAARGFLGDVLLSGIKVVTALRGDALPDLAASGVTARVDAQVNPGVYALEPHELPDLKAASKKPLPRIPAADDGGLSLVLIHGTFSSTYGTFSRLWTDHPQRVRALFAHYAQRVYAFDHPTLSVDPIENALMLAKALPQGARLHLVTHSRGGLVGEVLARVCAKPKLDPEDLALFSDSAYRRHRGALLELGRIVAEREIRIKRVVRVACPARGTLLASKRLDAYLSVFKWTLELAQVPIAPTLIDFLAEVALRRTDPERIPGLEAQMPDSPLVRWLHAVDEPIAGDLRVIAGDIEGDSVTSWLKTLLADSFYWTDNDLVVQTRSMYGGAPRSDGATYLYDQGGAVSHFSYFSNERTAEAIVNGLINRDPPKAFREIGPLSWAGHSATGARALERDTGAKPAVFVLPGILGSNLKIDGKRVWLSWRVLNGLKHLEYGAGIDDKVEPDGTIERVYDDLRKFLSASHHVVEFAFDWRKPVEAEAHRLAQSIELALDAREASGQPVRILAHSMGGIVARTVQLEAPETWARMMAQPGARLLMLGTPNGGSWAPMQVLTGDDPFGNLLVAFGAPFQEEKARTLMAGLPGFIQLQAGLLDGTLALHDSREWQRLAAEDLARIREQNWWHSDERQLVPYQWGVPSQKVLDAALALRRRLDAQRDKDLTAFGEKLVLVVGRAPYTPDGYRLTAEGLVYLNAVDGGDGRVTLESARLPAVRTWQVSCDHGTLPSRKEAFAAYLQLLETGDTELLDRVMDSGPERSLAAIEEKPRHVTSRPSRTRVLTRPPEHKSELFDTRGERDADAPPARTAALQVHVVHGDLTFVRQPLMLGHYRSMRLTGTEKVMDGLIGGMMSARLALNSYPDAPGSHQVFVNTTVDRENPWRLPRPEAVIVVGLGEEGSLRARLLEETVLDGVLAWAQRSMEKAPDAPAVFELASTLIGSGGIGITVADSAQAIARAVHEANTRLTTLGWPTVGRLYLTEVYRDRASEAWRALQVEAAARPGHYHVAEPLRTGIGGVARPLEAAYRGAPYDLIKVVTREHEGGDADLEYTLDTKRARSEVRAHATQGRLLRELIRTASNSPDQEQIGATLFQLLVPLEIRAFLGGSSEMHLELDRGAAGIPWELLDTSASADSAGDERPWAIRTKLLRKLLTREFRSGVADAAAEASVLIVGEPKCGPEYPRLSGAREEARAVEARLRDVLDRDRTGGVVALISADDAEASGPDALTILNALFDRRRTWRIVHIAGHGEPPELIAEPPEKNADAAEPVGDPRGVVLSTGYLGPREISSMAVVPELVFVNCCYLAAGDARELLREGGKRRYDRARFAAGVAEALIEIGVRCVVAAGWAVEDAAAKAFAEAFYEALLRGCRFIDAVAMGREEARKLGGNTWAAYQCYGDAEWTLRLSTGDAQRATPRLRPVGEEFAAVASHADLIVALETLRVQSEFGKAPADQQHSKIRHLEARFGDVWGNRGEVAEAFAAAWSEAGDALHAIAWYERALAANDGTASIRVAEQLANSRVRLAARTVDDARRKRDEIRRRSQGGGTRGKKKRAEAWQAELAEAEKALREAAAAAREPIRDAVASLEHLIALKPSMERESLCGSAYKRLALVEALSGDPAGEAAAIRSMQRHYREAEALGLEHQLADSFYPAINSIVAELALRAGEGDWRGLDPERVTRVRQSQAAKANDDPDFWSVIGQIDLDMYEAIAAGRLAAARENLEKEYTNLHARVSAAQYWGSVYDTARFVLSRYARRAPEEEKLAAEHLLRTLEHLAVAPST